MKNRENLIKFILVFAMILMVGCPGSKRDELEYHRSKVDSLRSVVNSFLLEENKINYESYINQKPFLLTPLYKKYNNLFSQTDINLINDLLKLEQRPERIDRLERLKVFIYERIVDKATAKIKDEIETKRHSLKYDTKFGIISEDDLEFVLANEPNQRKRKELYNKNKTQYDDLEKLNLKLYRERKRIILDSLRFGSYNQFAEMIRQTNLNVYKDIATKFLESTKDFYVNLLNDVMRSRRFSYFNFNVYDFYFIASNEKLERYFKRDSLLSIFSGSYNSLGLPIDSMNNLTITINHNTTKKIDLNRPQTRSFVISVPDEIKLNLRIESGCKSYYCAFYQSGYVMNMVKSKEKSLELKYFGTDIINHTLGNLFANQLDEVNWLDKNIFSSQKLSQNFLKLRALKKLHEARWLCTKFLIEYDILTRDTIDIDSSVKLLNYGLEYSPTPTTLLRITSSLDDYFQEIELIQALFIESMLKTKVREKFGNDWFINPDFGDYISKFSEKGKRYSVTEFLKDVGYYEVDPRFFYNEVIALSGKKKAI